MKHAPLALSLLLSLTALPALAVEWPSVEVAPELERNGSKDVALLISIEDYLLLPDVAGASKNTRDWETFLRDGLGVSDIITLRNSEAVREEILAAATRVRDRATEGGRVWFLFVGHGAPSPDGTDGLLVGADGQQNVKSLASRSVAQGELMELFSLGPQAETLMIVDACFSGRDSSGEALAQGVQPVVPVELSGVPTGITLMTAARSSEFAGALPGYERPAFSYLLLGAARGWADNGDGTVTAEEAVAFARNELADVVGREQTPQLLGDLNAVLAVGASEAAPNRRSEPAPVAAASPSTTVSTVHWGRTSKTYSGEPVTDDFGYFKLHLGAAGTDGFADLGVMFMLTPGFKIVRGHRADLRLGSWLGLTTSRNPNAPSEGSTYVDPTFGPSEIASVSDTTAGWFYLGAGPGAAFRFDAVTGGFDRTVYADSIVGLATSLGQYCVEYEREFISGCARSESRSSLALGARVGAEFPILDVAGYAIYRPNFDDMVYGITVGGSFDR